MALLAEPQGQTLDPAALLNNLVLIVPWGAGFPPQSQLEQFFGPLRSTGTIAYQGLNLVTLLFESGRTFTFCQHRRLLICGLDQKSVQRCIDQSLNRMVQTSSGLEQNQAYQGLKRRGGVQADFFLYADLELLLTQLPAARIAETGELELLPHHFAIFHQADAEHDRFSIIAQVRQELMTTFTDRHPLAAPVEDPVSHRISAETQLYLWTNWFNPKTLYHFGLEMCGQETGELLSFLAQRIFEETGKTIDDFFDVFGSRFGVFINEQRVSAPSIQSLACLYVEVHDQQQVEAMLKQLLSGLQMVTVYSGGTKIVSVIMAGGLLSPAYALVDNHLILADSVELIEQVQRQGGVKPDTDDKELGPARERAGNLFLFVRAKSVARRLIAMLTVLTKETADQTKILSPKTRLLLDEGVVPLLTGLQRMETSSLRGYATGNELMLEVDFSLNGENFRVF